MESRWRDAPRRNCLATQASSAPSLWIACVAPISAGALGATPDPTPTGPRENDDPPDITPSALPCGEAPRRRPRVRRCPDADRTARPAPRGSRVGAEAGRAVRGTLRSVRHPGVQPFLGAERQPSQERLGRLRLHQPAQRHGRCHAARRPGRAAEDPPGGRDRPQEVEGRRPPQGVRLVQPLPRRPERGERVRLVQGLARRLVHRHGRPQPARQGLRAQGGQGPRPGRPGLDLPGAGRVHRRQDRGEALPDLRRGQPQDEGTRRDQVRPQLRRRSGAEGPCGPERPEVQGLPAARCLRPVADRRDEDLLPQSRRPVRQWSGRQAPGDDVRAQLDAARDVQAG